MQETHIAPTDGMLHLPHRQRCLAGAFAQSALPFPSGHKKRSDLVGRPRLNVCFTARKALPSKPLLSRRGLGWLSASVGGMPPIQGQTPKLLQVHGGRPVPCWAQKKVRPCESDLEEAATYSPTG